MRKLFLLPVALLLLSISVSAAVTPTKPALKAGDIMIPLGNGHKISLLDLSRISISDVEILRGEKMKFADRLSFKAAQRKLRSSINPDGTITGKRIIKSLKKADGETGFHTGGFFLGFLLGIIGVIIAYIIKDEKKRNRVKWAWIGFGIYVVLYLLVLLLVA